LKDRSKYKVKGIKSAVRAGFDADNAPFVDKVADEDTIMRAALKCQLAALGAGFETNNAVDIKIQVIEDIDAELNNTNDTEHNFRIQALELDGIWTQVGLDIDSKAADGQSGWYVAMSSDDSCVAICAPAIDVNGAYSGNVRVYGLLGDVSKHVGLDIEGKSSGDHSGYSIAM
jgi:hypothetical protein